MCQLRLCVRRRLKQQLAEAEEDPAAAQWREKSFNFYDKRWAPGLLGVLQDRGLQRPPAMVWSLQQRCHRRSQQAAGRWAGC